MRVTDTFDITGRGLVVACDETTDLPVGKQLSALVRRPDGTTITASAYKEWLLRRTTDPIEGDAFLLSGLAKGDVPIGSEIDLSVA